MVEIQNSQIEVEEHQHFNIFSTETISLGGINVTPNTETLKHLLLNQGLEPNPLFHIKNYDEPCIIQYTSLESISLLILSS